MRDKINSHEEILSRIFRAYGLEMKWGSNPALAEKLGVKPNTISMWKVRGIPDEILTKVSRDTGVPLRWLDLGEGETTNGHGQTEEEGTPFQVSTIHQAVRADQQEWLEAYDEIDPELRRDLLEVVKAVAQGKKPPGNLQQLIPQDIAEAWLTATDEGRRGARLVLQASAEQSRAKRSGGSD